jgi:hypothetical protein
MENLGTKFENAFSVSWRNLQSKVQGNSRVIHPKDQARQELPFIGNSGDNCTATLLSRNSR